MKNLIRRLSRVADSSQYCQLRSESGTTTTTSNCSSSSSSSFTRARKQRRGGAGVPEGHLPVYVGEEMERFVVSAELLNHPLFVNLLNQSAQEYGYHHRGVLRIPCHVFVFERVLEALRLSPHDYSHLQHLFNSFSDQDLL
ncbi:auxin-responsive protein SAUR71-like [Coffea eugenioides]|uniref:Auxin-responsive protein SAUR71-like n=1 Tax=Coffea arabica TaxID=13443 RepID=A0A6P6S5R9_COFAR|nr:auxin-responsive protein SAUR71-like [Coffea arabica]XP_027170639.1 auxin-responsive protein SAUR71-like [Coffea eugenioides]